MESWRQVCHVPSSLKFHSASGRVPYAALAKVFALIEATTKRLEKTALLTSFLLLVIRRSCPGDFQPLLQAVYLCINRVLPLPPPQLFDY